MKKRFQRTSPNGSERKWSVIHLIWMLLLTDNTLQTKKKAPKIIQCLLMGSEGFGPTKDEPTDLQSAPFDHSGNSPKILSTKLYA